MAIHILASALSFSYDWRSYISWIIAAVCVLWLRIWLGGRKNTWEREWRQRRVIVVGPPTPQVLSLLDHLTSLNCKTLYLPPSLPPNLITLLNAIQLRSSIKPETFLAPEPEQDEDPSAPEGKPTTDAARGEGEKLLSAEAMDPRDDKAMLAFVRLWAKTDNAAGGGGDVGAGGRKVDAVVWAYGVGNVLDSSLLSSSTPSTPTTLSSSDRFLTPEEDERTRFLFFTLFLPQILNSTKTSSRSIRLVTLLHPIFPAGFSTSPLLHPSPVTAPTTTVTNDAGVTTTVDPLPPASYALRESYHAVRSILFTSHLQRILDALAMKGEAEAAEVPEGADESVRPKEQQADDEDVAGAAAAAKAEAATKPPIARRSNILAVSVAPGWLTSSVLRPFIGNEWNGNPVVALMWSLLTPLRLLIAPSSLQTIQSVIFALSAPPNLVGWGSVVKDCGRAGVPAALLEDEKLGRKVWEEMEEVLARTTKLPSGGGEADAEKR